MYAFPVNMEEAPCVALGRPSIFSEITSLRL
jgi:hypothetical protein